MEDTYNTSISMIDGKVEQGVNGRDYGVGIRIYQGFRSVYAYTNNTSRENLMKVALEAAAALAGSRQVQSIVLNRMCVEKFNPVRLEPQRVGQKEKVEVMKRAHNAAANFHEQISQVAITYLDMDQSVFIANSEGLMVDDRRIRTRLGINAVASKGNEKQSAFRAPVDIWALSFMSRSMWRKLPGCCPECCYHGQCGLCTQRKYPDHR